VKTPKPDRSQRQRIALVYTSSTGVEVLIEASWPRTLDWVGVREAIAEAARLALLEHAAAD